MDYLHLKYSMQYLFCHLKEVYNITNRTEDKHAISFNFIKYENRDMENYLSRRNDQNKQQKYLILQWNLALHEIVEVKSIKRIKSVWLSLLEDKYIQKSKNTYPSQESLGRQQTRSYKGVSERSNYTRIPNHPLPNTLWLKRQNLFRIWKISVVTENFTADTPLCKCLQRLVIVKIMITSREC